MCVCDFLEDVTDVHIFNQKEETLGLSITLFSNVLNGSKYSKFIIPSYFHYIFFLKNRNLYGKYIYLDYLNGLYFNYSFIRELLYKKHKENSITSIFIKGLLK